MEWDHQSQWIQKKDIANLGKYLTETPLFQWILNLLCCSIQQAVHDKLQLVLQCHCQTQRAVFLSPAWQTKTHCLFFEHTKNINCLHSKSSNLASQINTKAWEWFLFCTSDYSIWNIDTTSLNYRLSRRPYLFTFPSSSTCSFGQKLMRCLITYALTLRSIAAFRQWSFTIGTEGMPLLGSLVWCGAVHTYSHTLFFGWRTLHLWEPAI